MRKPALIACLLAFTPAAASAQAADPALVAQARGVEVLTGDTLTIDVADGTRLQVEAGTLLVPETGGGERRRMISIPYYRLRSTSDGPAALIVLGLVAILSLFAATLTTVGWLFRSRAPTLAAIDQRLAALENILLSRRSP